MRKCFTLIFAVLVFLAPAVNLYGWGWKRASDPGDVMNFLNGTGAYKYPVKNVKISATYENGRVDFIVYYERQSFQQPKGKWGWKRSETPNDVLNFINGTGAYQYPVKEAIISAVWKDNHMDFYVFYIRGTSEQPKGKWGWKKATSVEDAVNFLNGAGSYSAPIKEAKIAALQKKTQVEFYIFYQRGKIYQLRDNWNFGAFSSPSEVRDLLDGPSGYVSPAKDRKIIAGISEDRRNKYYVFKPGGFLIVTRPLFVNTLTKYLDWKHSMGFEVYTVTAEWIDENVGGDDIRIKIRNCIRDYYNNAGVQYAILIGDSKDIPSAQEGDVYQEPPEPDLAEEWNLPAGYYRWDCWSSPQYTSLYYADLNDKVHYSIDEHYYDGNYGIYVGLVPVRTTLELVDFINKTISYNSSKKMTFVYSDDLYGDEKVEELQAIQNRAPSDVIIESFVFGESSPSEEIYETLFEREGIIVEDGHGNIGIFRIGSTVVNNNDITKANFVNPLMMTRSCLVQAYHRGECLNEAFLKGMKGPATITGPEPFGSKPAADTLSEEQEGYWLDLFSGKSIGKAFCDHCNEAYKNPLHLFGDPSLVIVK